MDDKNKIGDNDGDLTKRFKRAIPMVDDSPVQCIALLESVQKDIQALGLFSKDETIDDVSTKSIPFITTDHHLAVALSNLSIGPESMKLRKSNILQSINLWEIFLQKLEKLEILSNEETKEFYRLLEMQHQCYQQTADGGNNIIDTNSVIPERRLDLSNFAVDRDVKVARYKSKQQERKEINKFRALSERRKRFDVCSEDEMDGHDQDSLERSLALKELNICKYEAFENWEQYIRELFMIDRMIRMDTENQLRINRTTGGINRCNDSRSNYDISSGGSKDHIINNFHQRQQPPSSKNGLQVTHITKDSTTGQLQFKRDEIRSKVFRPGWSQPTISLDELGEREYHQTIKREERQKKGEADKIHKPKRYDELVRDGMEDDPNLVDASAALDRKWDNWKDENPRGSGNKRANRGDKNF